MRTGLLSTHSSPLSSTSNCEQRLCCFFYWLFSVTAMKSLTMTARVDAVCNPLCCTWQPSSEAGQAIKWFWVVGWGFGVTAYLRDFLWCHLRRFEEEFPCCLIFDTVGAKVDRLELFFFNQCFNEDKRKQGVHLLNKMWEWSPSPHMSFTCVPVSISISSDCLC